MLFSLWFCLPVSSNHNRRDFRVLEVTIVLEVTSLEICYLQISASNLCKGKNHLQTPIFIFYRLRHKKTSLSWPPARRLPKSMGLLTFKARMPVKSALSLYFSSALSIMPVAATIELSQKKMAAQVPSEPPTYFFQI